VIGLWLPVVVWMATISYAAALPHVPGPAASLSDTALHVSGYAVMGLLTLRATAKGSWAGVTARAILLAFVIAVVHGLSVEVEQMFVPTRYAEWRDAANNTIGAATGLTVAWAWSKIRG